mmetsp:Transcript_7569/g.6916  ORF Transcript_7569/g.6916 Transcript_7569/m.6916 type:complete len:226 (-) Transcript_7569:286-963(-)
MAVVYVEVKLLQTHREEMHHVPNVQVEDPIILVLHSQDRFDVVFQGSKVSRSLPILALSVVVRALIELHFLVIPHKVWESLIGCNLPLEGFGLFMPEGQVGVLELVVLGLSGGRNAHIAGSIGEELLGVDDIALSAVFQHADLFQVHAAFLYGHSDLVVGVEVGDRPHNLLQDRLTIRYQQVEDLLVLLHVVAGALVQWVPLPHAQQVLVQAQLILDPLQHSFVL